MSFARRGAANACTPGGPRQIYPDTADHKRAGGPESLRHPEMNKPGHVLNACDVCDLAVRLELTKRPDSHYGTIRIAVLPMKYVMFRLH